MTRKSVLPGTRWWDGDNKRFRIIDVIDAEDGHTWVYYREDTNKEPKEYSCYIESFEQRFRSLPE